jgi:hypothetical protein
LFRGTRKCLADKIYILSGFKDLPYSNVFLNIGDAEYKSCACDGLSNLDFVQLKITIEDIYGFNYKY